NRSAVTGVSSVSELRPDGRSPRAQRGMRPMPDQSPKKQPSRTNLTARLDRAAGAMNAFLLVLAIGLATLDLTCLWALKMRDLLPAMARATATSTMAVN